MQCGRIKYDPVCSLPVQMPHRRVGHDFPNGIEPVRSPPRLESGRRKAKLAALVSLVNESENEIQAAFPREDPSSGHPARRRVHEHAIFPSHREDDVLGGGSHGKRRSQRRGNFLQLLFSEDGHRVGGDGARDLEGGKHMTEPLGGYRVWMVICRGVCFPLVKPHEL